MYTITRTHMPKVIYIIFVYVHYLYGVYPLHVSMCILKDNLYVTYKKVSILNPYIRVIVCGNGDTNNNTSFCTVGSVLRVRDAPLLSHTPIRSSPSLGCKP